MNLAVVVAQDETVAALRKEPVKGADENDKEYIYQLCFWSTWLFFVYLKKLLI